jgi:hypothetical protein
MLMNSIVDKQSISASCPAFMDSNYAICFAHNYLVGMTPVSINGVSYASLMAVSLPLLISLSVSYSVLGIISSLTFNLSVISISLAGMLTPLLTQLNYLINAIAFAVIGIEAQDILLRFISITAVPVLLPVGIVLRTLYVTRRLGGAIMAIAIGLFCVFPSTYLLNVSLASDYLSTTSSYTANSISASFGKITDGMKGSVPNLTGTENATVSKSILNSMTSVISGLVGGMQALFVGLANFVAFLMIEIFFLPLFSLILTAISIREFARILGSEISFGKLYMF